MIATLSMIDPLTQAQEALYEAMVEAKKEEVKPDATHIREQYIKDSAVRLVVDKVGGRENIIATEAAVVSWESKGVWEVMEDRALKQKVQRVIEEDHEVMNALVNAVTDVLMNDVYRPNHQFNIGDPEVINCLSGELHLDTGRYLWVQKSHNKKAYTSSTRAYEAFKDTPQEFDLVLTDQTMPEMTGEELARKVLAIRENIPIILCTGYSSTVTEAKAKQAGIKAFALKPLVKEEIASLVQKVIA